MIGKSPERIPLASGCGSCAGDCSRCPILNSAVTPSLLDSKQSFGLQEKKLIKEKPVSFGEVLFFRKGERIPNPLKEAGCPKCGRSFQSSLHSFCAECREKAA